MNNKDVLIALTGYLQCVARDCTECKQTYGLNECPCNKVSDEERRELGNRLFNRIYHPEDYDKDIESMSEDEVFNLLLEV